MEQIGKVVPDKLEKLNPGKDGTHLERHFCQKCPNLPHMLLRSAQSLLLLLSIVQNVLPAILN